MASQVTKRIKWADMTPMPGNPILEKRLDRVVASWGGYRPDAVGVPVVGDNTAKAFPEFKPDALIIIDGHHRRALALRADKGKESPVCLLWRGLTRAQFDEKFLEYADKRTPSATEIFLHRLGFDKKAADINKVVAESGFCFALSPGKGVLQCPSSVEWIWNGGDKWRHRGTKNGFPAHRRELRQALETVQRLTEGKPISGMGTLVKGLGAFYLRYADENVDPERLINNLQAAYPTPRKLVEAAQHQREDMGYKIHDAVGRVCLARYNGSRGGGRHALPAWS